MINKIRGTLYYVSYGDQKQPIASALLTDDDEIKAVWVDPNHRGKGFGSRLIAQILTDVLGRTVGQESKERELIYHCHPDNRASNALAKSRGFKLWHRWFIPLS